ncbi:MAG: 3'-5' exonuclease [Isosphaera sp.]|nr:3'-5' exonuclease [Isosphaera sp.]
MARADLFARTAAGPDTAARTAFLVVGTASVPDGRLLSAVQYPGEDLSPETAVEKARGESDALPVTFQVPVAVSVLRVGADFALQSVACLDAPQFRPREVVNKFWLGLSFYQAKLVTFNGRAFDLPLLELAAFRYGFAARDYYQNSRNRFNGPIDLSDWLTNFGACRLAGGLDLLAKLLGKPGKMGVSGDRVYELWRDGRVREVNDDCLCDALDTYFVFLRTRVLTGDIDPEQEADLTAKAKELLEAKAGEFPVLRTYLANWTAFPSP